MLIRFLLLLFLCASPLFGQTKTKLKSLLFLIDQNYLFYAHKKGNFYQIEDKYIKRVPEDQIYSSTKKEAPKKRNRKNMLAALFSVLKKEHDLYFTKGEEVFLIKGNKVIQTYPLKSPEIEWVKEQKKLISLEKDYQKKIERNLCGFCQFSLSGNYVNIENSNPQASPELTWQPHLSLTDSVSINFPLGFSSYLIEDENLNDIIDYALKAQIFARYKFQYFFIEGGTGVHKFFKTSTTSSISTYGVGRFFQSDVSIFSEGISLNYIYAHYSQVQWDKTLDEFKFGVGISF